MDESPTNLTPLQAQTTSETANVNRAKMWRSILDIVEILVLSALLYLGINAVSARIRVDGSSMVPTLHHRELVYVNKLAYVISAPDYGDVIVFNNPQDGEKEYIKRVIGLPGDHIQVADGRVYVNDQQLVEPYVADPPSYQNNWIVPEGYLFVLGDNRNSSSDSHTFGPIAIDNVIGKAIFVYWPARSWTIIE